MDEIKIKSDRADGAESDPEATSELRKGNVSPPKFYNRRGREKNVLVTDVSSGKFRYVYGARHKGILKVIDFGEVAAGQLGVDSLDPVDLHRAGVAWIEENANYKFRDILVVSAQLDFFIRKIELPLGRKSEVERAAKWEIEKQIPIRSSDSYLKIRIDDVQKGFSRITVGAAPSVQVNNWQFLGKKLIGVAPTAAALTAVGPKALSKDISYCYIYREESTLCIGFYNSDGLQYSHPIISSPSDSENGLFDASMDPTRIIDEFSSSMEVFYSRFPGMRVAGIVLFISSEEISQIAPILEENIVIDVIPVDFPENVDIENCSVEQKPDIKFLPLLGAALLNADEFLFLPKSLEDNIKNRIARKVLAYGFIAGLALIALLSLYWMAEGGIMSSQLKGLKAQKDNIANSSAYRKSSEYMARSGVLNSVKDRLTRTDHVFSRIHIAMGDLAPEHIFINSLILNRDKDPGRMEISGYFDGDLSKGDVAILNFMDNLKGYGFMNLKLRRLGSKLSGGKKTENFSITGELPSHD